MGWGTLCLITDDDREPREILAEFTQGFTNVKILHEYPETPLEVYAYGYECEADCGLTIYCSECGTVMCAGCGSRPFLIITVDDGAAGYCQQPGCRAARDRMLRDLWPGVPFANLGRP